MTIKNFKRQTFINISIIVGLLLMPSFLAAWAEDEGTLGTNILWVTFAKLFYVLRFPTHTLLWTIFSNGSTTIYFIGLIINCMFYGLLIERLISLFKAKTT